MKVTNAAILGDFFQSTRRQISLFEKPVRDNTQIMAAFDRINNTVGNIKLVTSGVNQEDRSSRIEVGWEKWTPIW